MMRLFIDGLAASAGGGLTYLRNVVPHLCARSDVHTSLLVNQDLRRELQPASNLTLVDLGTDSSASQRFWRKQWALPELIRQSRAEVLISTGNFALFKSPVPQILLSRNALYTSRQFFSDLRTRADYALWAETRLKRILAKRSVVCADLTVAPTHAFALELQCWTGREVLDVHHGFDGDAFFRVRKELPLSQKKKLHAADGSLRLLFVSHYNYYRNFETLFRAVALLKRHLGDVKLILTCKLASRCNPGSYRAESASGLVGQLGIADNVIELGSVSYQCLHHVYGACDLYVTPAYAESFAHPLVEAMASGLPIVASDLPVHREICSDAALFFKPFSPEQLADQVLRLASEEQLCAQLAGRGLERSKAFSWRRHVDQILSLAESLCSGQSNSAQHLPVSSSVLAG